ncbi:nitrilase [Actinoplanes sp. L3-i22]|uniref:nitrilase n=1 Tax=Actinoplanes sp. L3-i22 TaxID=2836373 RepID=UPI001C757541|nr:nitrilase [Actinoplanes sp. L3-i22]BCY10609.1 hypothetical protein L3i22_056970 [Actinoplanes sp. L3-i22]
MLTILAALLSGLLWSGGTGLHPIAALTWLAPLPLLLVPGRAGPRAVAAATAVAWLIGQVDVAGYYVRTLRIPVPMVAGVVVLGAALAVGTVLAARALLRRGRTVTAVLVVPALWVFGEYAVARLLPNGAWWSLAYTQADVRPVVQLAALTGIWGVTHLLLAVPIALAAVPRSPRPAVACLLALAVVTGGWAGWSLSRPPAGAGLTVGLVALAQPEDGLPIDQPPGRELLARYAARATGLAARGARVIVLPEKVFRLTGVTLPVLIEAFRPVGARVIVGAVLDRRNVAIVLGPLTTYAKQKLIPGLEDWLVPGHDDLIIDGHLGVAICKDLDFPGLVRGYRAAGATVMLVPALDFTVDGWLHSRMAVVRGVESGMTVVRSAASGRLTVSDPTGRIVGEAVAGDAELLVTVGSAGRGTVYTRTGDGFLIVLLIGVVSAAGRRFGNSADSSRRSA